MHEITFLDRGGVEHRPCFSIAIPGGGLPSPCGDRYASSRGGGSFYRYASSRGGCSFSLVFTNPPLQPKIPENSPWRCEMIDRDDELFSAGNCLSVRYFYPTEKKWCRDRICLEEEGKVEGAVFDWLKLTIFRRFYFLIPDPADLVVIPRLEDNSSRDNFSSSKSWRERILDAMFIVAVLPKSVSHNVRGGDSWEAYEFFDIGSKDALERAYKRFPHRRRFAPMTVVFSFSWGDEEGEVEEGNEAEAANFRKQQRLSQFWQGQTTSNLIPRIELNGEWQSDFWMEYARRKSAKASNRQRQMREEEEGERGKEEEAKKTLLDYFRPRLGVCVSGTCCRSFDYCPGFMRRPGVQLREDSDYSFLSSVTVCRLCKHRSDSVPQCIWTNLDLFRGGRGEDRVGLKCCPDCKGIKQVNVERIVFRHCCGHIRTSNKTARARPTGNSMSSPTQFFLDEVGELCVDLYNDSRIAVPNILRMWAIGCSRAGNGSPVEGRPAIQISRFLHSIFEILPNLERKSWQEFEPDKFFEARMRLPRLEQALLQVDYVLPTDGPTRRVALIVSVGYTVFGSSLANVSVDAEKIKKTLELLGYDVTWLGCPSDKVLLRRFPCGSVFLTELKRLLRGFSPGTRFIFYFTGHGFRTPESHLMFCLRDVMFPLNDLLSMVNSEGRRRIQTFCILDCCRNGLTRSRVQKTSHSVRNPMKGALPRKNSFYLLYRCVDNTPAQATLKFAEDLDEELQAAGSFRIPLEELMRVVESENACETKIVAEAGRISLL